MRLGDFLVTGAGSVGFTAVTVLAVCGLTRANEATLRRRKVDPLRHHALTMMPATEEGKVRMGFFPR